LIGEKAGFRKNQVAKPVRHGMFYLFVQFLRAAG